MGFTNDNQLATDTSGQAVWDVDLNSNWQIVERGFHAVLTAAQAINSGDVCLVNSAGFATQYDSRSLGNKDAHCLSFGSVASGANGQFLMHGTVRSLSIWSGQIVPGQPVYVSPTTPGLLVSSYAGAAYSPGIALRADAVHFRPGMIEQFPERNVNSISVGATIVGSFSDFSFAPGNRGIVRNLQVNAQSASAYKVRFWSSSARTAGTLMYETLTSSHSVGSVDVTTLNFTDAAMFPWLNSDTSSLALMFGRIDHQTGSAVNSSTFSVIVEMERFR
jgi:hypothetical protein